MASTDTAMKVAALGRPFTLGMMYDARTEQVVPGMSLWDPQVLDKYTVETEKPSSQFQVLASESFESKTTIFDIDASLKASFLGGMIDIGGSAKYLNDHEKSENHYRATFQYQGSTVFRELSLTSLGPLDDNQRKLIDMNLATHVVTGIVYGANAFFVFDSEKLESSSVEKIQHEIHAVMEKVPSFDVGGEVKMSLTEEEKNVTNKFSCTFYGDVLLDSNPTTFEDAVKIYVNLPKLLRESVAPLKVSMLPLVTLYPKAPVVPNNISIGLARKAQDVLEALKWFQNNCNEIQSEVVSKTFPDLGRSLLRFNNLCGDYIEFLQRALKTKLPLIREGSGDESDLMKLFQKRDASPFSQEKLSQWMDYKSREVTMIQSIVDMMDGTNVKLVKSQSELDKELLDAKVHDALCYVFTSLENEDPQLEEMAKYLAPICVRTLMAMPWCFSPNVLSSMREKAKNFHDLAAALKESSGVKFFMVALPNAKHEGASIYHYQSGALVTDDFSKPKLPDDPKMITNKQALMWYAVDLTFDPNTANDFISLSNNNKKATCGGYQGYPALPERFDSALQVICSEGLTGRCYWEVEWSDGVEDEIAVGVAYKQIDRKANDDSWFGFNAFSWCFGKVNPRSASLTSHNYVLTETPLPPTGLNRVGVFLDWPGGALSFYKVSEAELTHLHTFSDPFKAPVFPGCYLKNERSFIYFCPVERVSTIS